MLELKNISRVYRADDIETKALDDVSVIFRRSEFVSVLGPSGSGKTTLLNLIGGLDHYDDGDIVIDGVSTKDYSNRDWDVYRNHRIGFTALKLSVKNLMTNGALLTIDDLSNNSAVTRQQRVRFNDTKTLKKYKRS